MATPSDRPASISLEPCPFCGANEEGFRRAETGCPKVEELIDGGWRVTCYTCRYSICWEPFATEADALAAWNTRALSPDERLIEALRDLSFALAMGGGEETDPMKLVARVGEGVDLIQQVEAQRAADLIEKLSKTPKTTWGQVKTAVLNRAGLPRALSTTKADQ